MKSSPGQIDRLKAQIGNDPRCERIWCARQDNAFLLAQHHSKCLDVRSRHRFPPALWNDPGSQQKGHAYAPGAGAPGRRRLGEGPAQGPRQEEAAARAPARRPRARLCGRPQRRSSTSCRCSPRRARSPTPPSRRWENPAVGADAAAAVGAQQPQPRGPMAALVERQPLAPAQVLGMSVRVVSAARQRHGDGLRRWASASVLVGRSHEWIYPPEVAPCRAAATRPSPWREAAPRSTARCGKPPPGRRCPSTGSTRTSSASSSRTSSSPRPSAAVCSPSL